MNVLDDADTIRLRANKALNPKIKSSLGQYFTNAPICLFMASLFTEIKGKVKMLDPGCGSGSLTAAFTDEAIKRGKLKSLDLNTFDVEKIVLPFINQTLSICESKAINTNTDFSKSFELGDYVLGSIETSGLFNDGIQYTHCIMNPPYKKIATKSDHRLALRTAGIKTVNLYSGFVALAIQRLVDGGELVAIIPRSFCNGPYYQPFRELIIKETAIKHIHIFDSRSQAFSDAEVLQENVIIHLIKGKRQSDVTITSSPIADFHLDEESQTITASDLTTRTVSFDRVVNPKDKEKFIHIAANERDQAIISRLSIFSTSLNELNLQVSTGPVVDFRLKEDLRQDIEEGAVPLIYPIHLNNGVQWPKDSKKPNAIQVSDKSKSWLWSHTGHFVIVRRFSSKEEKRRIIATPYDSSLPGELIGFENKLNVFNVNKEGFDKELALGLYVYLNSTLLDKYYRLFGGHTQINATDLKNIHYPSEESLRRIGSQVVEPNLNQNQIDQLLDREFFEMTGDDKNNPLNTQEKLDQALEVLTELGMPNAQKNERSALTFLALINLHPEGSWQDIEKPMIGVTPIMDVSVHAPCSGLQQFCSKVDQPNHKIEC